MAAPKINRYPLNFDEQIIQIGTAGELTIALDLLQGQFDRQALEQLSPHLAEIVANASGFMQVARSLSPENQVYLIQSIGTKMADVIGKASALRDILATQAEHAVEQVLFNTLGGDGLRQLIHTGAELAEVLEWVYGEQDALALKLLGDAALRRLCANASGLSAVLHNLDFELQVALLEQLGWPFVIGLVKDARDLASLLRALPPQASTRLLDHFSGLHLRELIGSASEWAYLYQRLEPAEAEKVMMQLSE